MEMQKTPPRSWNVKLFKVLGEKEGKRADHLKAVPVLILEKWIQGGREKGVANCIWSEEIADRLEDAGLAHFEKKGKGIVLGALVRIQNARNLTRPKLIEYVKEKKYFWINLPHYENVLQDYRRTYQENYRNDYKKLFPSEPNWGVAQEPNEPTNLQQSGIKLERLETHNDDVQNILELIRKAFYEKQRIIEDLMEENRKLKIELDGLQLFSQDRPTNRERIPEEVRNEVWRRDGGKCARCGSREKLEFDHIVPISRGGGNTVRNIELLCEKCNRKKGNKID